ncbi:amino acid ABC transporter permease [Bacillus gaemokensis]|uniref:Arginine ABC transporter permease n=1 Tax=Bacillus gaemokensis TaxID=574375 RepID=A0A073KI21_9BACI|nr:amino acid ABC transporter permease [Bacillus gaemokensis]KEK26087.1 arginine ABC transporter permease [Bacillus gaemokensis]KYG38896.1 arginine ABC transporter permease [Bacillus gaemokensis]
MNLDFSAITPSIPYILKGLEVTLKIVAVSALIGFVLGTLLALCKIASIRVLNIAADLYTSIFRGTPLVLQLMIIYFGVPQMIGYDIPAFLAAVLAFSLNSGAYMSEVIRAGIQAVDKGQTEAAMALGVPYGKMMKNIILPQALKNILPALVNEFATLTKESAVVTVIGATDLMRRAYIVGGETFKYLEPLLFVGLVYYILVIILTLVGKVIEGRMKKSD